MKIQILPLIARSTFGLLLIAVTGAGRAGPEPVVSVVAVESRQVSPTLMVTGTVQSRFDSAVSAGIHGTLTWVAETGTRVEAGELLARLESRPFELTVRELEARIAHKNIDIQRLSRNLERLRALHSRQSVSSRDLDNMAADLALAQADRELLEVSLDQARDDLARTEIRAPFAGMVAERLHQQGETISATQPVVQLINTEQLEIRFHGPLEYSDFPQALGELMVYFGSGSAALPLRATVPLSDAQSQSFAGFLNIPAELAGRLRIGELTSVAIPTALPAQQFIVPRDALVLGDRQTRVFVLDEAGKALAIPVSIGADQGDYLSVTGALAAGQQVIVRGAETIRSGDRVTVLTAEEFPVSTLSG